MERFVFLLTEGLNTCKQRLLNRNGIRKNRIKNPNYVARVDVLSIKCFLGSVNLQEKNGQTENKKNIGKKKNPSILSLSIKARDKFLHFLSYS